MSWYKYSTSLNDNCAKAVGLALPVSRKHTIMVCQAVRGLSVPKAKLLLEGTTKLKTPIPFTRFNQEIPHRKGSLASGRFPAKAAKHVLDIIKSAEANAQFKGLSTGNLIVKHASAQKGPTTLSMGRQRRLAKRTHVEIVLEEIKK